jgi:hypothetical protein
MVVVEDIRGMGGSILRDREIRVDLGLLNWIKVVDLLDKVILRL